MSSSPKLEAYLRDGIALAGSQRQLAKQIGISEQRLSRVVNGRGYPLGLQSCLRLGRYLGLKDPGEVLRACGRTADADLLEQVYGPVTPKKLTSRERAILDRWRLLSSEDQAHVMGVLESLARSSRHPANPKKR